MLEFSPKEIKRAERESIAPFNKEQSRKIDVKKTREEKQKTNETNRIFNEGATFTGKDKKQTSDHIRGASTPAGDSLEHGPRGGRFNSGKGFTKLR